jgi:orotate phosphoribosyltransferase
MSSIRSSAEALEVLRDTGVLKDGHFILTSGLHSDKFLLCAQALQYPRHAEALCRAMAEPFREAGVETVMGPALGGIILSYEVARTLGARSIFTEKKPGGGMELKRGFMLRPGERVLAVEDALTTGGSIGQVIELAEEAGAKVIGAAVLVDRSGGTVSLGVPFKALVTLNVDTYPPENCPLCRDGVLLERPKG